MVKDLVFAECKPYRGSGASIDYSLISKTPKSNDKSGELSVNVPCMNVRSFEVPKAIITSAILFFEIVNLDGFNIKHPPAVKDLFSEIAMIVDSSPIPQPS